MYWDRHLTEHSFFSANFTQIAQITFPRLPEDPSLSDVVGRSPNSYGYEGDKKGFGLTSASIFDYSQGSLEPFFVKIEEIVG